MKQTTEQKRAKAAWEQIEALKEKNKLSKEFVSTANGASSLIHKVGFGQAVAFWLSKGKHNKDLVDILSELLLENDKNNPGIDLMEHVTQINSKKYRILNNKAIAYLFWIKRFAKAQKDHN